MIAGEPTRGVASAVVAVVVYQNDLEFAGIILSEHSEFSARSTTSASFRAGTTATTAGHFASASLAGARAQIRWSPRQNRPLKKTR